jgi:hypothetical protein
MRRRLRGRPPAAAVVAAGMRGVGRSGSMAAAGARPSTLAMPVAAQRCVYELCTEAVGCHICGVWVQHGLMLPT